MHQENILAFDTMYNNLEIDDVSKETIQAMRKIYGNAQDDLSPNTPPPQGRPIKLN